MEKAERIKLPRKLATLDGVYEERWQWAIILVPIGLLLGYLFLANRAKAKAAALNGAYTGRIIT